MMRMSIRSLQLLLVLSLERTASSFRPVSPRLSQGQLVHSLGAAPSRLERQEEEPQSNNVPSETTTIESLRSFHASGGPASRRILFGSALVAAGSLLGAPDPVAAASATAASTPPLPLAASPRDALSPWYTTNPVNKRSGVTVGDAEVKGGYNLAFCTYLSRFLLNFDAACQSWWFAQPLPTDLPPNQARLQQFGSFAASVEVGLQPYVGRSADLLALLLTRYCPPAAADVSAGGTEQPLTPTQRRQRREIKEARRQLALLFGLLDSKVQPTAAITKLLAAVDNGSVERVVLAPDTAARLTGYARAPLVNFTSPQAGTAFDTAQGVATMVPTGQLLRLDITTAGAGYNTKVDPAITISPPQQGTAATAKVKMRKGQVETIQILDAGSGYTLEDLITVTISAPEEGVAAVLSPVLELRVDSIQVTTQGSGYAVEKPLSVYVTPPQDKDQTLLLAGYGYPRAEKDSYTTFRKEGDNSKIVEYKQGLTDAEPKRVSGTVSGPDNSLPPRPFWGKESSSSQLLDLLPAGVGLEYDGKLKSYKLAVDKEFKNAYPAFLQQSSTRPYDIEFGPRGRAPIERDMELSVSTYLRFCASGAICASGVHLALTPLDVVKTKVQTNPTKYPTVGSSFSTIYKEEGLSTFFTGWVPTLAGNFLSGAVLYALTEAIRRSLSEAAGMDAMRLEVPIILIAAGTAATVGSFLSCPFEAVRIRSVAQPDYAPNTFGVVDRMVKEEGAISLINAVPVFLAKNVPYAMTKFTVFDISTEQLYEAFPAAHEELKLSLLITLVGGVLGGISAACISNPADAVISELKKSKSDMSPQQAVDNILERAGVGGLFKGLPLRMVFYSLVASLQFLVYDGVRFALGIGPDDLKLYLDVLGGALTEGGGPV